jgi:Fe-S cluster biogenesis protein NfuA
MSKTEKEILLKRIDEALNDIRPHLAVDGGDIEVVDVTEDYVVVIKWLGNCENCFMSAMTMKAGIEETLKNKISEVTGIEAINGVEI